MENVATPGKMTFVEVKLKAPWLGHPKGSTVNINSFAAQSLINRKSASLIKKKKKAPSRPEKNKMVTEPVRKKRA